MIKIALDFDNVLADSMNEWCKEYNCLYNPKTYIYKKDIDDWNFERKLGISTRKKMEIFEKVWREWRFLKPEETFQSQTVQRLNDLGIIYIATDVPLTRLSFITEWCLLHDIPFNGIHSFMVNGKTGAEYDVFIDDNPEMAIQIRDYPNKTMLLFDQPWNQHISEMGNVRRIFHLDEAEGIIRGIVESKKVKEPKIEEPKVIEPDEDFDEDDEDDDIEGWLDLAARRLEDEI